MGRRKDHGWNQHQCVGCGDPFATMSNDEFSTLLCPECIHDFGITSDADVKEFLDMFGFHDRNHHSASTASVTQGNFTKQPEKPKVDPKVVAAGVRTQCDYKVMPISEYKKPITYVCAKNGLWEVRKSDLATVIVRPKEVLGVVEELKEGLSLNLPKVPFLFLQQTVSFFRGVEQKMNNSSEALVQVWWDRETKTHEMHVPEQNVSGGSVHHRSVFDLDNSGRYFHVMDIHSHGSGMSAFWSGTDNNDEQRVTTDRLFGVIGRVKDPMPVWKWRMRTRDGFIDLSAADIFEMPTGTFDFTVKSEDLFRSLGSDATFKDGRVQLWCPVNPFENVEVPAAWYDQVKRHSYTGHQHGGQAYQRQLPAVIRGFIYINGQEYESDGTNGLKATGKKLLTREEFAALQTHKQEHKHGH